MAAILRDSVAVVVVRTRPQAIALAMIIMGQSTHRGSFSVLYGYGALLLINYGNVCQREEKLFYFRDQVAYSHRKT